MHFVGGDVLLFIWTLIKYERLNPAKLANRKFKFKQLEKVSWVFHYIIRLAEIKKSNNLYNNIWYDRQCAAGPVVAAYVLSVTCLIYRSHKATTVGTKGLFLNVKVMFMGKSLLLN